MLKFGLGGFCLTALSPVVVVGQNDPASMPPQEGDLLVKLDDPGSKPLGPADIVAQATPLMAWPMDPASKIVRKASRLNEVLLIRADDVLAYSALCPHAGCDVTQWIPEQGILSCDCHQSEFDAKADGRVVGGPAARPLPPLLLKVDGDLLVVAKPFAAPIRFDG